MKWYVRNAGKIVLANALLAALLLGLMHLEGDKNTTTWAQMSAPLKFTLIAWWMDAVVFLVSFVLFFYRIGRSLGEQVKNR